MKVDFDIYSVSEIINPSKDCVQVVFEWRKNPDVKKRHFVIFEQQVKYIIVDEHKNFKRVKVYFRWDDKSVHIDFQEDQYELFEKFMKSIYNH